MAYNTSISGPITVHTTGLLVKTSEPNLTLPDGSKKCVQEIMRDMPIVMQWRIPLSYDEIVAIAEVRFKDLPFKNDIIFGIKSSLNQYMACGYIQIGSPIQNKCEEEIATTAAQMNLFSNDALFQYVRMHRWSTDT